MKKFNFAALRILLILMGLGILFIGIDVGLGGLKTLGLQGRAIFFEVTNEYGYLIQDSHSRFLGGLFGGIGFILILAVTNISKYQSVLKILFVLIFIGGLARLSQGRFDVIFNFKIIGSFIFEIILMPILFFWVSKITKDLT